MNKPKKPKEPPPKKTFLRALGGVDFSKENPGEVIPGVSPLGNQILHRTDVRFSMNEKGWGMPIMAFRDYLEDLKVKAGVAALSKHEDEEVFAIFIEPEDAWDDRRGRETSIKEVHFVARRIESDAEYQARLQGYIDRETQKRLDKARDLDERIAASERMLLKLKEQRDRAIAPPDATPQNFFLDVEPPKT
jgi:hypothetical protein